MKLKLTNGKTIDVKFWSMFNVVMTCYGIFYAGIITIAFVWTFGAYMLR